MTLRLSNIVWYNFENNAPNRLQNVSFVKGVQEFENPEIITTLIVLDDLMNSAYSTKVANYLPQDRTIAIFF